jgi:alanine racemase
MNMVLCNITDHDSVSPGDEVILIGAQNGNEITFNSFAEMNNAMNYEILARLPEHVPRISVL